MTDEFKILRTKLIKTVRKYEQNSNGIKKHMASLKNIRNQIDILEENQEELLPKIDNLLDKVEEALQGAPQKTIDEELKRILDEWL